MIRVLLLLLVLPFIGCVNDSDSGENGDENGDENGNIHTLEQIAVYPLQVNDPSGLTIDASGDFLWTVSDDSGDHIYKMSFTGDILDVLPYEGDDMEGITMNPNDHTLWVAEERLRQIVQLDTLGQVLQVVNIDVDETNPNDGLEGIAIHPVTEHLFVLNEKNPRLFIELNRNFQIVREVPVNFSPPYNMTDVAGLWYDHPENLFWIVSDESEKIVITDFDLNPLHYYELDHDKFEGIAVDRQHEKIYLVNDRQNRLYVFALPDDPVSANR